ncbi:PEBP-like protein [Cucurbitaria berberidis CBS 394.84]|uniref:PEBP-like protein n=1 Tax=Cucurbitaria berberidis CBS 394.84 TaxID=1168544 RepID=A0A9P4GEK9_9PLEO|nr:PEBP-like protein [Cucurbitaria berberidis CBS 394.84]KAF1844066.1 PEBP-like protein [Cucurbitaria berberidis CBS 394.84]
MFGRSILSFGALLAAVVAQTAPGFPIKASEELSVNYGTNTISPPGERVPRNDTALPPSNITIPTWPTRANRTQLAVLLLVDLDVPRNNTRVQLLHWLATNISIPAALAPPGRQLQLSLASNDTNPDAVPYLQPSPPPGDVPHSYTFVLFAQPADFALPVQYANLTGNRVGFNTSQFVTDTRLGSAVAANWFTVQNLTGTPTMTFPPARATETKVGPGNEEPSGVPSPGAGVALRGGGTAAVWAGVVTALFAGVAAFGL